MAASDIFADTSGFFALWDTSDEYHRAAVRLQQEFNAKKRRFVTSDYIVDETVTMLMVRHSREAAADFLQTINRTAVVRMEWIGPERFHKAVELFERHEDKEWSFTDCTSFALMRELGIREALTADQYFRQAGFASLLRRQGG